MNKKLEVAYTLLEACRIKFKDAERTALEQLKFILEPVGEHGVSICPLDYIEYDYESIAEADPHQFYPITLIRYWNGKLEVFISEYKELEEGRWEVFGVGQWIDYEKAHTDTWFMLDQVAANLEWADYYDEY